MAPLSLCVWVSVRQSPQPTSPVVPPCPTHRLQLELGAHRPLPHGRQAAGEGLPDASAALQGRLRASLQPRHRTAAPGRTAARQDQLLHRAPGGRARRGGAGAAVGPCTGLLCCQRAHGGGSTQHPATKWRIWHWCTRVSPLPSLPHGCRGVLLNVPVMGSADSGAFGGKLFTTVLFPAVFSTYPNQNTYFWLPLTAPTPHPLTEPPGLPQSRAKQPFPGFPPVPGCSCGAAGGAMVLTAWTAAAAGWRSLPTGSAWLCPPSPPGRSARGLCPAGGGSQNAAPARTCAHSQALQEQQHPEGITNAPEGSPAPQGGHWPVPMGLPPPVGPQDSGHPAEHFISPSHSLIPQTKW